MFLFLGKIQKSCGVSSRTTVFLRARYLVKPRGKLVVWRKIEYTAKQPVASELWRKILEGASEAHTACKPCARESTRSALRAFDDSRLLAIYHSRLAWLSREKKANVLQSNNYTWSRWIKSCSKDCPRLLSFSNGVFCLSLLGPLVSKEKVTCYYFYTIVAKALFPE